MPIGEAAMEFFDACETGKGWDVCRRWCHEGATFSAQADALADIKTLEGYTEWQKNLLVPVPNGHYEMLCFGVDEDKQSVAAAAVFHGTHTVDAGTGAPTGKSVSADYCYMMQFDDGKINHMTKIWNDVYSLKKLGWM